MRMTVTSKSQRSAEARAVAASSPFMEIGRMLSGCRPRDPAAGDIVGQAAALRIGNAIEADGGLACPGRQHRLRLVVDLEAGRHVETDAELAMQERLAADIAFLRAVAVKQPVDAGEIIVAAAIANGSLRTEGAGMPAGKIDALRRARVARRGSRGSASLCAGSTERKTAIGGHRIEETGWRHKDRIRLRPSDAHADDVGLQFLVSRERPPA